MSVSTVYEGVGGGGMLFDGKKFWVALRIPSRNHYIQLLKSNGGKLVPNEKEADILIADHAIKNAPAGSYSWTYIEKSVKNGQLENIEDHVAGPAVGFVRPVGSGSSIPRKGTRTPFSAEDDRFLMDWVTKAEAAGTAIRGNKLYEDLEKINPRHPYQAWRDRWIKHLQQRQRPTPSEADHGQVSNDSTRARVHGVGSSSVPPASSRTTPNHRDSRLVRQDISIQSSSERSARHHSSTEITPTTTVHRNQRSPDIQNSSPKFAEGQPFTAEDAEALREVYLDVASIDEKQVDNAWMAWAVDKPQHTPKEWHNFWLDVIKPERQMPKTRKTKKRKLSPADPETPNPHVLLGEGTDGLRGFKDEAEFVQQLKIFCEACGVDVNLRPSVSGQPVSLFRLWNIVASPEFNGFNNIELTQRWPQVATQLNFNSFQFTNAPSEVRTVYETILKDFADSRELYNKYLLYQDEEDEDTEMEESAPAEQQREDSDDNLDLPLSLRSPKSSLIKLGVSGLPQAGDFNSSQRGTMSPMKRQRVDKGRARVLEVPSTPEELISSNQNVSYGHPNSSPNRVTTNPLFYDSDSQEEPTRLLPRKLFVAQRPNTEPETQDFHFSSEKEEFTTVSKEVTIQEDEQDSMMALAGSAHEDSSTQSQTDSQRHQALIDTFVDSHIALGYPAEIVVQALKATSMDTGDASIVMEAIFHGSGIPEKMQGVWTEADDLTVRAGENADDYQRIREKHGVERCLTRAKFLKDTDTVSQALSHV